MTNKISQHCTLDSYMNSMYNRLVVLFLQYDTITIDCILATSW